MAAHILGCQEGETADMKAAVNGHDAAVMSWLSLEQIFFVTADDVTTLKKEI